MYWRVYAIRYIVLSYMLVATPVVEFQDCCQLLCMCNEVWKDGVTMCNLRSICWWVELLCILSKGFQNGSLDVTLSNLRSIQIFLFYIFVLYFFNTSYWGVSTEKHKIWCPMLSDIWNTNRGECLIGTVNLWF